MATSSTLLESARPFLCKDLNSIDKNLPKLLTILHSTGTDECWHRSGTFYDHLYQVYRILKLWKAPDPVCTFGLFHSAYSNSYSDDLAIFGSLTNRETVRQHVGPVAESLIHLFCIVPRYTLIDEDLVFRYTDAELREHLQASSEYSLKRHHGRLREGEEAWRKKLQELVPATGVVVNDIRTGEPVVVPRRVLAVFVLLTIADLADQFNGYQDEVLNNTDGRMELTGNINMNFDTLWPGNGKPGLHMNLISKMGAIYTLLVREEEIYMEQQQTGFRENGFEDLELVVPPVFDRCTKVLDPGEQMMARDLYWEAVYHDQPSNKEMGEELLIKCIEMNPFVGEPHVLLSQFYMSRGRFEEGKREGEKGLGLLLEWGCAWDKRVSWEGWVSWCRVLVSKAKERSWPHTSWGIISLGHVK